MTLGDGIAIERLDTAEADAVMDAAEPAGENFRPARQWSQLVTFVRRISDEEYDAEPHHGDNWDRTGALAETVALSRFVYDNAFCSEYAARIIEREGAARRIVPDPRARASGELGLGLADVDWRDVYGARSDASHGARVALFSPPGWSSAGEPHPDAVPLVAAAQAVLRAAVKKTIEDEAFRRKFATDASVRAAWPWGN